MPKQPESVSINLLPGKESAFGETFLNWVLSIGRYIIIGTEIIVLIAFLSRFKLDRDLIDLNDQIKEKQAILQTLKPVEDHVLQLQARLAEIKRIDALQGSGIAALPGVATLTPAGVTYKNIFVTKDKITISGKASQTTDISRFVALLKSSALFKEGTVSLEKIEQGKEADNLLSFTVSAIVAKEKG